LNQLGAGHVGLADHHARREGGKTCATIGLADDHGGDLEAGLAQPECVAYFEVQPQQQARVSPDRTRWGATSGCLVCLDDAAIGTHRAQGELATQWVSRAHCFDCHELGIAAQLIWRAGHAGEHSCVGGAQAQLVGDGSQRMGHGLVGHHERIAAQ
jgi:hypothetical protein